MDKLDKLDKLDDFYNDPYTDMEIISKEGTMFWVSQHRLKKTRYVRAPYYYHPLGILTL